MTIVPLINRNLTPILEVIFCSNFVSNRFMDLKNNFCIKIKIKFLLTVIRVEKIIVTKFCLISLCLNNIGEK